jgi:flagellar L-ring protein precursor FlgH
VKALKRQIQIIIALTLLSMPVWAQEGGRRLPSSLFTDQKAFEVGDLVTILLMEYSQGSNESSTNTGIEQLFESSSGATGAADILPSFGLKAGIANDNKSNGGTSRQGSLRGKLSARVVEVLSNNNLKLEGQRKVLINGEEQVTVLTGIVRREDVAYDNTVFSYLISDASISFKGNGVIDEASKPGILTRAINWLF